MIGEQLLNYQKIRFNHNLTTVVKPQIKQCVDMKLYYLM